MFNKSVYIKLLKVIGSALHRISDRRAGVALIVALSSPLLIAATGLSVDIGYWYQQQATLQSAADAAALAAATSNANSNYNVTVANYTSAQPYALGAANSASNSQFGLTNASVTLAASTSTVNNGPTINAWTAKATIPRAGFFSSMKGMGLAGMLPGFQSASATADVKSVSVTSGGSCLLALSTSGNSSITGIVSANGNALVDATGCNITADSTACDGQNSAITASGNAIIETTSTTGPSILTAGCTYTSGSAKIVGAGGNASNNDNVSTGAAVETDPLWYMGDPPTFWENMVGTAAGDIPACTVTSSVVSAGPCVFTTGGVSGNNTITFTGGSYFFPNGFSASGNANVNFGPGIYYLNGNFNISGNGNYTTTNSSGTTTGGTIGATFVLENKASYDMSGNSSGLNLSAPTSNCVAPANYNAAASSANNNTANFYNLTQLENGKGICGILIYQARNDTSSGTISGNGTDTINGLIYAPDASFASTGNGSVSATNGGTLAVLASQFNVSGNGQLNVAINGTDIAGQLVKSTTTTTVTTLLVQ